MWVRWWGLPGGHGQGHPQSRSGLHRLRDVAPTETHPRPPKPDPVKSASGVLGGLTPAKAAPVINNGSPTILGKRSYEQHNGVDGESRRRPAGPGARPAQPAAQPTRAPARAADRVLSPSLPRRRALPGNMKKRLLMPSRGKARVAAARSCVSARVGAWPGAQGTCVGQSMGARPRPPHFTCLLAKSSVLPALRRPRGSPRAQGLCPRAARPPGRRLVRGLSSCVLPWRPLPAALSALHCDCRMPSASALVVAVLCLQLACALPGGGGDGRSCGGAARPRWAPGLRALRGRGLGLGTGTRPPWGPLTMRGVGSGFRRGSWRSRPCPWAPGPAFAP